MNWKTHVGGLLVGKDVADSLTSALPCWLNSHKLFQLSEVELQPASMGRGGSWATVCGLFE